MNIKDMLSGKEKLKFGDKEQIEVIEKHEEEMKKKSFKVTFCIPGRTKEIEVRAHNKEDAKEIAIDELYDYVEWDGAEVNEVEEIEIKDKP